MSCKIEYAVNKDGKKLFYLYEGGESYYYLGGSKEQVILVHLLQDHSYAEFQKDGNYTIKTDIEECRQVLAIKAKTHNIGLDEYDEMGEQKFTPLSEIINEDGICYENGVALIASSLI